MVSVPQDAPAWAKQLAADITRELRVRARGFPVVLPPFLKADLPDPVAYAGSWIFVTDATGGAVPAYASGGAWLRSTDATVIS